MRKRTPESGILRACLDLLAVHKIWHRRWNTGAVKDGDRFFRFGKKGDADIICTPMQAFSFTSIDAFRPRIDDMPVMLWLECKSDSGKQTPEQIAFEKEVSMVGHHYLVVRDVNQLSAWLKEHGCI